MDPLFLSPPSTIYVLSMQMQSEDAPRRLLDAALPMPDKDRAEECEPSLVSDPHTVRAER